MDYIFYYIQAYLALTILFGTYEIVTNLSMTVFPDVDQNFANFRQSSWTAAFV